MEDREGRYLLDTNALILYLYRDALSAKAKAAVLSSYTVCVSVASFWEIAIKQSIGKLDITNTIEELGRICEQSGIGVLPIQNRHLDYIKALPKLHGDPFDRLIIAQAVVERLTLITRDRIIPEYCGVLEGLQVLW